MRPEKKESGHCGRMSTEWDQAQCTIDIPNGTGGNCVRESHSSGLQGRSKDIKFPLLSSHPHILNLETLHIKRLLFSGGSHLYNNSHTPDQDWK